jgi:hypothetical protein
MFIITTIGVSIAMGLNWRRLGKTQWTMPTIVLGFVLPILVLVIVFALLSISTDRRLVMSIAMFAAGLNFGFVYALQSLQHGAYKKWMDTYSVDALMNYEYDFRKAGLIAGLVAIAATLLGVFISSS